MPPETEMVYFAPSSLMFWIKPWLPLHNRKFSVLFILATLIAQLPNTSLLTFSEIIIINGESTQRHHAPQYINYRLKSEVAITLCLPAWYQPVWNFHLT